MIPAFLTSPLFRALLIVAFITGVFGSGYLVGKRMADQSARIAELERDSADLTRQRDTARAERDVVVRQAKAANDIAAAAVKREQAAQSENDELEGMVRGYEKLLSENTDRSCGFSPADVERLQQIYDRALGRRGEAGASGASDLDGSANKVTSPEAER